MDLSINYDNSNKQFVIDRSRSGRVDFSPMFSKKIKCDYDAVNQTIPLKFIVDKSSIEIFINEGDKIKIDPEKRSYLERVKN